MLLQDYSGTRLTLMESSHPHMFNDAIMEVFYNVSRHYFDEVIKSYPLVAVKVATLLAMVNIMQKQTVALAFVGESSLLGTHSTRLRMRRLI